MRLPLRQAHYLSRRVLARPPLRVIPSLTANNNAAGLGRPTYRAVLCATAYYVHQTSKWQASTPPHQRRFLPRRFPGRGPSPPTRAPPARRI